MKGNASCYLHVIAYFKYIGRMAVSLALKPHLIVIPGNGTFPSILNETLKGNIMYLIIVLL